MADGVESSLRGTEWKKWLTNNRGGDPWQEDDWKAKCAADISISITAGALLSLAGQETG